MLENLAPMAIVLVQVEETPLLAVEVITLKVNRMFLNAACL